MTSAKQRLKICSRQKGFTMAELAILLMIISVIAGTIMIEMLTGATARGQEITLERMRRVEQALYNYYQVYAKLPCPASGELGLDHANYGRDLSNGGACPTTATAYVSWSDAVMGTAPVRTLGLSDEYALDGWGRRINYIVDTAYTTSNATPPDPSIGARVSTATAVIASYPAFLISYGKAGNGAFPANGSTIANRLSVYSGGGNANERQNIGTGALEDIIYRPFMPDVAAASRFDQLVKPISLD